MADEFVTREEFERFRAYVESSFIKFPSEDESSKPIEYVTIQIRYHQQPDIYKYLSNHDIIYEEHLQGMARVERGALKLLKEEGFEFEEINYENPSSRALELRSQYFRDLFAEYGIDPNEFSGEFRI